MKTTETIPVYIRIENGKTVCICHAGRRKSEYEKCRDAYCTRDVVVRDKFAQWKQTMKRDRFGK